MNREETTGQDLTNELLQALLEANDEVKRAALRVLRGEPTEYRDQNAVEPYLTLREIGRQLNVSPCSLWRWGVPGHDLGGRRRFRMSEVQAYLESPAFRKRADELKRERQAEASGST